MNPPELPFLQYGALGILMVMIYFAGKIALVYVTAATANQTKLIDGTLERMKELAAAVDDNTKSNQELFKAINQLTSSVLTTAKDSAEEHKELIEGVRRLGGFRPSSDREIPVQRPPRPTTRYSKREDDPESG